MRHKRRSSSILLLVALIACGESTKPLVPSSLQIVSGDAQTDTVAQVLPVSLVVIVTAANGAAVRGVRVSFAITSGGGALSADSALTDADGKASVRWTLGTIAGSNNRATASVEGLNGSPINFIASALPAPPSQIVTVSGNGQVGTVGTALSDSFVVRITDQYGNPVSGVPVAWSVTTGGGSIGPSVSTTDAVGRAAALRTLGTVAGNDSASATLAGVPALGFGATANPGTAASILAIEGQRQTGNLGGPLANPLTVKVTDQYGNAISGQVISWTVRSGGGSITPANSTTDQGGQAAVSWILGTRLDTTHVSIASSGTLQAALFEATPLLPASAVLMKIAGDVQVDTVEEVLAESLAVKLVLADGRPVQGATITWSVIANPGLVSPVMVKTNAVGRAATSRALGRTPGPGSSRAVISPLSPVVFADTALLPISFVSAGVYHSCALRHDGGAYCWGANSNAQLGTGSLGDGDSTPKPVASQLAFSGISPGYQHSCGLVASGAAYCWGTNGNGQVGTGSTSGGGFGYPVPVFGQTTYSVISSGKVHTCAVTSAGVTYCWGYGNNGQLGNGSITTNQPIPVQVSGNLILAKVSSGGEHTCGVTAAGAAYCWGSNSYGQLGDSTSTTRTTPVLVKGSHSFSALTAGEGHTCGVTASGDTYCWGDNRSGQLGDGTTNFRTVPTRVVAGLTFALASAGNMHTCGVTRSGEAYCWGRNDLGQLGQGYVSDAVNPFTSPVLVTGGRTFADLHAGAFHTCAVATDRLAYCWGFGLQGQLGNGSTANQSQPVRVKYQP